MTIANVSITRVDDGDLIRLDVKTPDGNSDTAIDTMLLAILQTCCTNGFDSKAVITRTAFRMGELAKTLAIDPTTSDT